jgi:hypothetical protein
VCGVLARDCEHQESDHVGRSGTPKNCVPFSFFFFSIFSSFTCLFSLIFPSGAGAFAAVLPTFVLVSRMQFAQRYRGNDTFSAQRLLHDLRQ